MSSNCEEAAGLHLDGELSNNRGEMNRCAVQHGRAAIDPTQIRANIPFNINEERPPRISIIFINPAICLSATRAATASIAIRA